MASCYKCGMELPQTGQVCPYCGKERLFASGPLTDSLKGCLLLGVVAAIIGGGCYLWDAPQRRQEAEYEAKEKEVERLRVELDGKDEAAVVARLGRPYKTEANWEYQDSSVSVKFTQGKVDYVSRYGGGNYQPLHAELEGKDEAAVVARLGKAAKTKGEWDYQEPYARVELQDGKVSYVRLRQERPVRR